MASSTEEQAKKAQLVELASGLLNDEPLPGGGTRPEPAVIISRPWLR